MTESKNIIIFELEQSISQTLKENLEEKSEPETFKTQSIIQESNEIDKKRMIKQWKMTEGYFYLHPEKFLFSNKDL